MTFRARQFVLKSLVTAIAVLFNLSAGATSVTVKGTDFFRLREGEFAASSGLTVAVRPMVAQRDQDVNGPWYDPASYSGGHSVPYYEIEARQGDHFLRFYFNPLSGEATRTPYRTQNSVTSNGSFAAAEEFELESIIKKDGLTTFKWKYGSWRTARKQNITMSIDEGGFIRAIGHELLIGRSGPSGWHSGPFKSTFDKFHCEGLMYPGNGAVIDRPILDL